MAQLILVISRKATKVTKFRIKPAWNRSSHQKCSLKKGILGNLTNFTEKHLCWSLFLIKLQRLQHRCFPVKFAKFLRRPISKNI